MDAGSPLPEPEERDESLPDAAFCWNAWSMGRKGLPPPVNGMNGACGNTRCEGVSRLTERLMSGIDYEQARLLRMNHFLFLHERLGHLNRLSVEADSCPLRVIIRFGQLFPS